MTPESDKQDVTAEVASEGGTPGDVEVARTPTPGVGSEGTETWRPADSGKDEVVRRDETGEGRRTP